MDTLTKQTTTGHTTASPKQTTKMTKQATTATRRIRFEDRGQDFLYWDIDPDGVVIDCHPYHREVWKGCIVDLETLKEGKCLEYVHPRLGRGGIKYRVVEVENLVA